MPCMFSLRGAETGGKADCWSVPLEALVRARCLQEVMIHDALSIIEYRLRVLIRERWMRQAYREATTESTPTKTQNQLLGCSTDKSLIISAMGASTRNRRK